MQERVDERVVDPEVNPESRRPSLKLSDGKRLGPVVQDAGYARTVRVYPVVHGKTLCRESNGEGVEVALALLGKLRAEVILVAHDGTELLRVVGGSRTRHPCRDTLRPHKRLNVIVGHSEPSLLMPPMRPRASGAT